MGRERKIHVEAVGPATGEPPLQGLTRTWVQAEGSKRGVASAQERRQTQARGAERRDKRRSLVGGGYGIRPGGRRF